MKVHHSMNLQFAPAQKVAMKDVKTIDVQFTTVHFPYLNPNSYGNLNNMKLDLNVSTT